MISLRRRIKPGWGQGLGSLAVPIAALALLSLLASLQYQWIGRISRAEGERLRASLEASTSRFTQDLNGEVALLYISVAANRRPGQDDRGTEDRKAEIRARFQHWASTAPNRNLVRNLYVAEGGPGGLERFNAFDLKTQRFNPSAWPAKLSALHAKLEEKLLDDARPGGLMTIATAEDGAPVIASPQFNPSTVPGRPSASDVRGWSIIELDSAVLASDILPELVQKHFGPEYFVEVRPKDANGKPIFRSPDAPKDETFATPDVKEGIFDVRPSGRTLNQIAAAGGLPGLNFERFRAAFPPGAGPAPDRTPGPPGASGRDRDRSQWWLLARHRKGSLDRAVSEARTRNLAISMAILALMGGSIALLVVSARRAHRLANLQMEFVAGISHELRTPLSVICSAADNLADGLVNREQQIRRYGALIRNEGHRLTDMVEQILGFAGFESGKRKLDRQPVDIRRVLDDAVASCRAEIRDSGCTVETAPSESLPPVLGDATTLTQCFRNLVSNAIKYGKDGGWVGVWASSSGGAVEVTVEDRGPGIAAADLPYIFDPFYRGGKAVSEQIHGAGIGLSLVKRIVEAHSGRVDVDSVEGRGSRFIVRLPAGAGRAAVNGGLPTENGATHTAH